MANRNTKAYSNTSNKKRVPKNNNVPREKNKKLENTTRIRVDRERLNDSDSLDTSFLEGRIREKNSSKVKEKILREKKKKTINFKFMKSFFFLLGIVCIFILVVFVFVSYDGVLKRKEPVSKKNTEVVPKVEKVLDDNYLFVGDFYTDSFDFEEFQLDYHYVKVSDEGYTTEDILGSIKDKIYDYNPSILFIELGINDLKNDRSEDEIIDTLRDIIDSVKTNRAYASIYIESLYPINDKIDDYDEDILDEVSNKDIVSLNKKIEKLAKQEKVHYIDLYSELKEGDVLKEKYTDDGVHLNKDGYKRVFKVIRGIVDDEHKDS